MSYFDQDMSSGHVYSFDSGVLPSGSSIMTPRHPTADSGRDTEVRV